MAIVAPPSEDRPANFTVPTILNRCTGPRAITPIGCPTAKFCLLAVAWSMSTWSGPLGQWPEVKDSGLKRWPDGV